ncbi:unnamed protein product, partial [Schistosoma turkestanicum]
ISYVHPLPDFSSFSLRPNRTSYDVVSSWNSHWDFTYIFIFFVLLLLILLLFIILIVACALICYRRRRRRGLKQNT